MTYRLRGLGLIAGSVIAWFGLMWFHNGLLLDAAKGGAIGGVVKWLLMLPVLGTAVGLIELATGVPIQQADAAWQRMPGLVKYPAAIVFSVLFLWGFLWVVGKALGA